MKSIFKLLCAALLLMLGFGCLSNNNNEIIEEELNSSRSLSAFSTNYPNGVFFRGTPNEWPSIGGIEIPLVGNNLREVEVEFGDTNPRFKISLEEDGWNNCEPQNGDILINEGAGKYTITFDETKSGAARVSVAKSVNWKEGLFLFNTDLFLPKAFEIQYYKDGSSEIYLSSLLSQGAQGYNTSFIESLEEGTYKAILNITYEGFTYKGETTSIITKDQPNARTIMNVTVEATTQCNATIYYNYPQGVGTLIGKMILANLPVKLYANDTLLDDSKTINWSSTKPTTTDFSNLEAGTYKLVLDFTRDGYTFTGESNFTIKSGDTALSNTMTVTSVIADYSTNFPNGIFVRGTNNNWPTNGGDLLPLIGNNLRELVVEFGDTNPRFKISLEEDGWNNCEPQNGDILINEGAGKYTITFDETKSGSARVTVVKNPDFNTGTITFFTKPDYMPTALEFKIYKDGSSDYTTGNLEINNPTNQTYGLGIINNLEAGEYRIILNDEYNGLLYKGEVTAIISQDNPSISKNMFITISELEWTQGTFTIGTNFPEYLPDAFEVNLYKDGSTTVYQTTNFDYQDYGYDTAKFENLPEGEYTAVVNTDYFTLNYSLTATGTISKTNPDIYNVGNFTTSTWIDGEIKFSVFPDSLIQAFNFTVYKDDVELNTNVEAVGGYGHRYYFIDNLEAGSYKVVLNETIDSNIYTGEITGTLNPENSTITSTMNVTVSDNTQCDADVICKYLKSSQLGDLEITGLSAKLYKDGIAVAGDNASKVIQGSTTKPSSVFFRDLSSGNYKLVVDETRDNARYFGETTFTINSGDTYINTQLLNVDSEAINFTSNYPNGIFFRGTPNSWPSNGGELLPLVANNLRELEVTFGNDNPRFKISLEEDGWNNCEPQNGDIFINEGAGTYKISFDETKSGAARVTVTKVN